MKTPILRALGLGALIIVASCQKDNQQKDQPPVTDVEKFKDIVAPSGFAFNTFNEVNATFFIRNKKSSQASIIEVYDNRPTAGGELIYKGVANERALEATLQLPSALKKVYVVRKEPSGSSTMEVVEVQGNQLKHSFGSVLTGKSSVTSPDCNSGCDQSFTDEKGNFQVKSNDPAGVYCLIGNTTANINVNRNDVVIRICGTADINNLNLDHNARLEIVDAAVVNIKNLNINSSAQVIIYDAVVTIENDLSVNGSITNHGNLSIDKSLNLNSGSGLTNNGSIRVDADLNNNDNLVNNGNFSIGRNANFNGGSTVKNHCQMIIGKDLNLNNTTDNHGYIEVANEVKINGGSLVKLHDGAMLYGKTNAHINSVVNGTSNTSLVKIDGNVQINSGAGISGNLELCANGNLTNYGTITAPATLACDQVYIPTSSCNPNGNGTPAVADADNDGVPDAIDDFPNDPSRAAVSYYPAANSFATLAFEDLWPAQGDYDFNDLVVGYRYSYITNASNDLVEMKIDYSVRAAGAGYRNGLGLELEIAPSSIQSISRSTAVGSLSNMNSNGTEAGQSKAVIIFFDNANDELPNPGSPGVNTTSGMPYATPDTSSISITFSSGQSVANLGSAPYNPFLIVNQNRSREIHMANQAPTDLAAAGFFGNSKDDSDPATGRYYVTKNNLPWVINISGEFSYPAEKKDMVKAYPYFSNWATSGGSSYTNWYADLAGHRNPAFIY